MNKNGKEGEKKHVQFSIIYVKHNINCGSFASEKER